MLLLLQLYWIHRTVSSNDHHVRFMYKGFTLVEFDRSMRVSEMNGMKPIPLHCLEGCRLSIQHSWPLWYRCQESLLAHTRTQTM